MKLNIRITMVAISMILFIFCFSDMKSIKAEEIEGYGYLIPHTHDDVGWLKTAEQYYDQEVKHILQNIVKQLDENPSRRFNWQESYFFNKFWKEDANDNEKEIIKRLVKNKQWEFVGGGWVCNDEATTTVDAIVDQMSTGHELLHNIFGDDLEIKSTWQIDPFGHSKTMAVFAQNAGYKYHVLNRVDERLDRKCKNFPNQGYELGKEKGYQFYWDTNTSGKEHEPILTHIMDHHYSAENGDENMNIDFEKNPSNTETNLKNRAQKLAEYIKHRAKDMYRTKHILLPFGDDFRYYNFYMFRDGDKLIAEINNNTDIYKVKIQYATVSEYFEKVESDNKAQSNESKKIPTKTYDAFMPYANCYDNIDYWTGYYTTYPKYKLQVRDAQRCLRHVNIMHAFGHVLGPAHSELLDSADEAILSLRRELGMAQHHDAITGTSKEFVRDDYSNRLKTALDNALDASKSLISIILSNNTETSFNYDATLTIPDTSKVVPLVIQNPQMTSRSSLIRLSSNRNDLTITIQENDSETKLTFDAIKRGNTYDLFVFVPNIPALGYRTIFIVPGGEAPKNTNTIEPKIENAYYSLRFDKISKTIKIIDKSSNEDTTLTVDIESFSSDSSGAYLFIPDGPPEVVENQFVIKNQYNGPLVQEIQVEIAPNFIQTFRLFKSNEKLIGQTVDYELKSETDWIDRNLEYIVTFKVHSINNQNLLYSDANALETVERRFEAVRWDDTAIRSYYSGNVYPMTSYAFIKDSNQQFTLFSPSSFGVASFNNSELSVMIRRSSTQDDHRGVGESVTDHGEQIQKFKFTLAKTPNIRLLSSLHDNPSIPIIVNNEKANDKTYYLKNLRHFFNPVNDLSVIPLSFRHLDNHEILLQVYSGLSTSQNWDMSSYFNADIFEPLTAVSSRPLTTTNGPSKSSSMSVSASQLSFQSVSFSLKRKSDTPDPVDPKPDPDPDHPTPKPQEPSSFFEFWSLLRFSLFFAVAFGLTIFIGLVVVGLVVCLKRSRDRPFMSSDNLQRLQIFTREDSYDELDDEELVEVDGVDASDASDPLSTHQDISDDDADTPGQEELETIAEEMHSNLTQQNSTSIDDQFDLGVVDADDDKFSLM